MSLRVGLIGCGQMGCAVHLNNLRCLPGVELVALAETDPKRREAASRKVPRAAIFANSGELTDQPDVEAVVVCLPNALHAEAAVAVLQSGKHLYLEKPLAVNLEDGRKILEVWRSSGKVAIIGFNYRFNPLHLEMRRHLQAGLIGELIGARSVFTTGSDRAPEWKQTRQSGGGALLDLASHHVDLMRFWFNKEVLEVRASVASKYAEGDSATLDLRLEDNVLVHSFFSTSSVDDDRFEIYGRAGKLSFDRFRSWKVEITGRRPMSLAMRRLRETLAWIPRSRFALNKIMAPARESSFAAAMAHFVAAARKGQQASPNFEAGFKSLAVIISAEDSARTGRPAPVAPLPE